MWLWLHQWSAKEKRLGEKSWLFVSLLPSKVHPQGQSYSVWFSTTLLDREPLWESQRDHHQSGVDKNNELDAHVRKCRSGQLFPKIIWLQRGIGVWVLLHLLQAVASRMHSKKLPPPGIEGGKGFGRVPASWLKGCAWSQSCPPGVQEEINHSWGAAWFQGRLAGGNWKRMGNHV